MTAVADFDVLEAYLRRLPAVQKGTMGRGELDGGGWWLKFGINIAHELAWPTVQELATY